MTSSQLSSAPKNLLILILVTVFVGSSSAHTKHTKRTNPNQEAITVVFSSLKTINASKYIVTKLQRAHDLSHGETTFLTNCATSLDMVEVVLNHSLQLVVQLGAAKEHISVIGGVADVNVEVRSNIRTWKKSAMSLINYCQRSRAFPNKGVAKIVLEQTLKLGADVQHAFDAVTKCLKPTRMPQSKKVHN